MSEARVIYERRGAVALVTVNRPAAMNALDMATLAELDEAQVVLRDLSQGLVDFPALRDGEEIYLCWLEHEPEIGYWHDLESGFAGRQPL